MKTYDIVLLAGDGVGPEVTESVRSVLSAVDDLFGWDLRFTSKLIGGAAIDAVGDPLPEDTLDACLASDAVFLGAVGGPKWDGQAKRPEQGLLALRKGMGLFANLRPVSVTAATAHRSPLRPEIVQGVDMLMFRELTGGVYFGEKKRDGDTASDLCVYTVAEVERIARMAFAAARERRGLVTSIDKANVLETSRLWRETVTRLHEAEFSDVKLEHALVDSAAMKLIQNPRAYDVILTENMFGDILSDEASVLPGSIGLLGSASIGASGPGLFEPIHGSAPDIAGKDLCNPTGSIMAAAMLLRYGLKLSREADLLETVVGTVLAAGRGTADLGGEDTCSSFTAAVVEALTKARWTAAHGPQMHWA
jgi:3-isopropylmalate dehydrogenase